MNIRYSTTRRAHLARVCMCIFGVAPGLDWPQHNIYSYRASAIHSSIQNQ